MLAIAYSTFIPPQWNSKRDISSFSIVTKESCRFTGKWGRAELMSEYVTVATWIDPGDSCQTSLPTRRFASIHKGNKSLWRQRCTSKNCSKILPKKCIYNPRLSNYKEIVEVVPFPRRISSLFSSPMFTQYTWYEEQWVGAKIFFFWFSSKLEQQANRIVNRKFFEQVNRQF